MTSSKRTCVFCGGAPLTLEHHPPQWLNKYYEGSQGTEYVRATLDSGQQDWGTGSTVTPNKIKVLCQSCNNGWISSIDAAAKDILGPMTQGVGTHLSKDKQIALATWMVKSALLTGRQGSTGSVDTFRAAFEEFYRCRSPSDKYVVYIATFREREFTVLNFRPYIISTDQVQKMHLFTHVAVIGHFVGYVFFRPSGLSTKVPRLLRQIWPPTEPFIWPVGPFLTEDVVRTLTGGPFGHPPQNWAI